MEFKHSLEKELDLLCFKKSKVRVLGQCPDAPPHSVRPEQSGQTGAWGCMETKTCVQLAQPHHQVTHSPRTGLVGHKQPQGSRVS